MSDQSALLPFLAKLERHASLSGSDREAILALPHSVRTLEAGAYFVREGERANNCWVIVSGFACSHKVVINGARQILSVHMKGDGVDLQNALLAQTNHSVQALTRVEAALVPAAAVSELMPAHPGAARALWVETMIEASIQREWTANVGRRDARTRVAHLLCEIGLRIEAAGIGERGRYGLPMTQEQLADATGLTPVHVNRVLQGLGADQIIDRDKRLVEVADWNGLAAVGDFRSSYLHSAVLAA